LKGKILATFLHLWLENNIMQKDFKKQSPKNQMDSDGCENRRGSRATAAQIRKK
jgi:hypothetical protein